MALESSPLNRKTAKIEDFSAPDSFESSGKPEKLDVYTLALDVRQKGPDALKAALDASYTGWKNYAKANNYFPSGEGSPLSQLAAKRDEAEIIGKRIRNTYLEYTGEKDTKAAWPIYNPKIQGYEAELMQILKDINGPIASAIEFSAAEGVDRMITPEVARELTAAEHRGNLGAAIGEIENLRSTEAETPASYFRDVVAPAAETRFDAEAAALSTKGTSVFSRAMSWLGGTKSEGEQKKRGKTRPILAALGALGLFTATAGPSIFQNFFGAPRAEKSNKKVENTVRTPEAALSGPPLYIPPVSVEGEVNNADRLFGRFVDQIRDQTKGQKEVPLAARALLAHTTSVNGMHEQDVLTRWLGFQKDGESPYVYEGDSLTFRGGAVIFTQKGVEHYIVDEAGNRMPQEELEKFLEFKKI